MNTKLFLLSTAAIVCCGSPAFAQLAVPRFVIATGGATRTTGGAFGLGGTIGQGQASSSSGGSFTVSAGFWFGGGGVTAVEEDGGGETPIEPASLPLEFHVSAPSPNPVAEEMFLAFDLPEPRDVRVEVFDAGGRMVRTIVSEHDAAGHHRRAWDRRDNAGNRVAGGIYFLRMTAAPDQKTQKLVLLP